MPLTSNVRETAGEIEDAKGLKKLEKENTELKKIMTDQILNIQALEAVNSKVVSRDRSARPYRK